MSLSTTTRFHPAGLALPWAAGAIAVLLGGAAVAFLAFDTRSARHADLPDGRRVLASAGTTDAVAVPWREERESWGPFRPTDW